ncbi:unnamed protein product [Cuscuta campestris]|uniref:Uncharacterized protein n=1 Tax=Cuscuta campestris TaxID=132261 RepID=A0A484LPB1_9ASTE|nr:unnamed protein product [Cuscuta campestris]
MFKHSPSSRSHRSKGIKTKHVLQICLLLAVCFWLIYQVKRSYDKGKEFNENDPGFSMKAGNIYEPTKWGRKTLLPHSNEMSITNAKQDNDSQEDDEDTKSEEVEQDQDNKFEDENDEDRGGGDDAVDEHGQEKSEEQEDELVDDEKEGGEVDGTEIKGSGENNDHELDEENNMSTHEALYKGDDASSAVTHDTQTVLAENGNIALEDSDHEVIRSDQNITQLASDNHERNRSLITTGRDESILEHVSSNPKNISFLNQTSLVDSHLEVRVSFPNLTESNINSTIEGNITADGEDSLPVTFMQQVNATVQIVEKTLSDSNTTSIETENLNSISVNSSSVSTITPASDNATYVELKISGTENLDEIGQDLIDQSDTSISLEEKDIRMDLETLPEIQTEGTNADDAAAE